MLSSHIYQIPLNSDLVLFEYDFYCKGLPKDTSEIDEKYSTPALLYKKIKVDSFIFNLEMQLDPRFLVSSTSFGNIRGHSKLSGIGIFLGCTTVKGINTIKIRPLAIGSSGP